MKLSQVMTRGRLHIATAGVADQFCTSLGSFLVVSAVARNASVDQFAQFSLAIAVLIPMITTFTLMPGNWLIVEATYEPPERMRTHLRGAVLLAMGLGLAGGLVADVVSVAIGVHDPAFLLALPALLAGQLTASILRTDGYRRNRPTQALGISGSILFLFGIGLVVTHLWVGTWTAPVWAYVLSHWLVLSVPLLRARWFPSIQALLGFTRLGRESWKGVGADMVGVNARQLILPYVAAAFAGLPAAAGIRGAQALAGLPLQVSQGLLPLFQAKLARIYAATHEVSRPILRQWTIGQCTLLIPCVVIAIFVPDVIGEFFLGSTWAVAGPALPWILLAALGTQLTRTKEMRARLTGDMDVVATGRLASIPPSIVAVGWLGAVYGPLGAAVGVFIAHALMYILISLALERRLRVSAAAQAAAPAKVET